MNDESVLIEQIRKKVIFETDRELAGESFQYLRCLLRNARMRDADGESCVAGECGCSMEIYLKFRNGHVEQASYVTDGENEARICGSFVASLAIGKSGKELLDLRLVDVLNRLGFYGSSIEKCALLALSALQKAVEEHSRRSLQTTDVPKKQRTSTCYISAGKSSPHLQYTN